MIALNYADVARKKHLHLDLPKLSQILGCAVINTIAIKGIGVHELVDAALKLITSKAPGPSAVIYYGPEIEERVNRLTLALAESKIQYPVRWTALKLLENDPEVSAAIVNSPEIINLARSMGGRAGGYSPGGQRYRHRLGKIFGGS